MPETQWYLFVFVDLTEFVVLWKINILSPKKYIPQPQPISAIEDFNQIIVQREDDITCSVSIFMHGDRVVKFFMEDRDACEFSLCLAGYYRLLIGE